MESVFDYQNEFLSFQKSLKTYLYRLCCNKSDMEDLLHDTFIKVNDNIHNFRGQSSFKTWVFAIATNLAKDNMRVRSRWLDDTQDKCKQAAVSDINVESRIRNSFKSQTEERFELIEHINYCFTCLAKTLTLEQQISVILKEVYAFSRKEIADILGISESVVKHYLFNGRKKLIEKFNNRCAMVNKKGICHQCAELNDYLQGYADSSEKIKITGLHINNDSKTNYKIRVNLIKNINPLEDNGSNVEDTILQILRETIDDK